MDLGKTVLHIGPPIQRDFLGICLRFRQHQNVICSDMKICLQGFKFPGLTQIINAFCGAKMRMNRSFIFVFLQSRTA